MFLAAEWGDVSSWFAAVGTVGALVVALTLLRNEMRDRRRIAEIADERPASCVYVWLEPRSDAGGWQSVVRNTGEEPVYNAVVYFTPLTDPPLPTIESLWGTIPPGEPMRGGLYGDRPSDIFGIPPVEIEFTGGRGRHWRRDAAGKLDQISQRTPFC